MVVFMALTVMISAPIMAVGGIIMALRQDVPLSGLLVVILPIMVARHRARDAPGDPALPGDADASSTGSTRSCARRWPASGSSGPSSGRDHEEARFDDANQDLFEHRRSGSTGSSR